MADQNKTHVTELVNRVSRGDPEAAEELLPLIYDELRQLAQSHMARERAGHTLQATALVHEAYLQLVAIEDASWVSRSHFFKMASTAMRRLLVDHAREKNSLKAGGGKPHLSLDEVALEPGAVAPPEILEVDWALELLEQFDPELAEIVQLRFFGGLEMKQIAETLELSKRTAERRWNIAQAWLLEKLRE